MAVIKCKICGGDIELSEDKTIGTCMYCGSTTTLPKIEDEQRASKFNRGNHFRRIGEYDKALATYERIVAEDDTDAEAHWCCALSRFGIEYVEDPATYEWLPTCHRLSFDSFLEDVDYLAAVENSDGITRRQYQKDGAKIAEVQRGILAVSQKEEPFDVFICYKESDENNNRTIDSTLAQDIYYQLTDKGYKVFFSRITLEDKAGTEYEPYIFAALNSAKVMIVVGTKPEYLNAVWVKNEWSRFLSLMKKDRSRVIIPCYRDMDPYDLPEQLSVLQSYDMSKIGFVQDLLRGIEKIVTKEESTAGKSSGSNEQHQNISNSVEPLLKRVFLFLEEKDWPAATNYCERVLDYDPENARAYLGKLLSKLHLSKESDLFLLNNPFDNEKEFEYILRFGDEKLKKNIQEALDSVKFKHLLQYPRIAAAYNFTVAIQEDGTLLTTPFIETEKGQYFGQLDVQEWTNLAAVTADSYVVGLRSDGTVLTTQKFYDENYKKFPLEDLKDVVKICSSSINLGCLRKNGTVIVYGGLADKNLIEKCDTQKWERIISIDSGWMHIVGLVGDGTVVATGDNKYAQCNVEGWKDIVAVSAGHFHTIGLRKDGTVISTGKNKNGECDVDDWKDIIAISAGHSHTIGLKRDGTVVATGINENGECNVDDWKDIIAVSAGCTHTIGLRKDGTVISTEYIGDNKNNNGQTNINHWNIFKLNKPNQPEIIKYKEILKKIDEDKAREIIPRIRKSEKALQLITTNFHFTAALHSDGTVKFTLDSDEPYFIEEYAELEKRINDNSNIRKPIMISSNDDGIVALLYEDGTVEVMLDYENCFDKTRSWNNIKTISFADNHIAGLKEDGSVVAIGANNRGQCNVDGWMDIIQIVAKADCTVGLRNDGTVVFAGGDAEKLVYSKDWNNIASIMLLNGTFGASLYGLRRDGTIVTTSTERGVLDTEISSMEDIIAIHREYDYAIALDKDGKVHFFGKNKYHFKTEEWNDVITICGGRDYLIGLKENGTMLVTGDSGNKRKTDLEKWVLFSNFDNLEEERRLIKEQREIEEREFAAKTAKEKEEKLQVQKEKEETLRELKSELNDLENELSNLRGLFSGKRRKELESQIDQKRQQIYEISKQL